MAEETNVEDPGLQLSPEMQREKYRKLIKEFPYLVENIAAWTGNDDRSEEAQLADLAKPGPAKKHWDYCVFMGSPFHIKRAYGPTDTPTYVEGETLTLIVETATISDHFLLPLLQSLKDQRGLRRYTYENGEHIIDVEATTQERRYHEIETQPRDSQKEAEEFLQAFPTKQRFEEVLTQVLPGILQEETQRLLQHYDELQEKR